VWGVESEDAALKRAWNVTVRRLRLEEEFSKSQLNISALKLGGKLLEDALRGNEIVVQGVDASVRRFFRERRLGRGRRFDFRDGTMHASSRRGSGCRRKKDKGGDAQSNAAKDVTEGPLRWKDVKIVHLTPGVLDMLASTPKSIPDWTLWFFLLCPVSGPLSG
jgi:hypothetical protein